MERLPAYALSRTYREGLCGGADCAPISGNRDDDGTLDTSGDNRADTVRGMLNELDNDGVALTFQRNWDYDNGYILGFRWDVADIAPIDDGKLRIEITLQSITGSAFETLNDIEGRVRDLRVDVCLGIAVCTSTNTETAGLNRIEFLQRVQLAP